MKIKQGVRVIAVAASAAVTVTGAGVAAAATTSPPPGATLVKASCCGWTGMSYRPGRINIGNGAAPFVSNLSWSAPGTWTSTSATTRTGDITQFWPNGGPSYTWPHTTRRASVYLHDRLTHNGHPYFAKMRWNWVNANGRARVAYWLFTGVWEYR
jgi:hypothetical protein